LNRHLDTLKSALPDICSSSARPPRGNAVGRSFPLGGFVFTEAARMIENRDYLDRSENAFDRRSIGRTKICKDALLFFSEATGVHSCTVRDVTNLGAGIRIEQNLKIVPLDFALSFDNFRTIRMCRLVWRQGDFLGVVFES
jgi:hypothetical protein